VSVQVPHPSGGPIEVGTAASDKDNPIDHVKTLGNECRVGVQSAGACLHALIALFELFVDGPLIVLDEGFQAEEIDCLLGTLQHASAGRCIL